MYSKTVYDRISGAYNITLWFGQKALVIYVVQTFLVTTVVVILVVVLVCVQAPEIVER